MNRIILSAIASLATLVTLSPATASTFPTETVSYGDLDLSTDGGRAELDQRVRGAVKRVCGTADPRDVRAVQQRNRCLRTVTPAAEIAKQEAIASYQTKTELRLAGRR